MAIQLWRKKLIQKNVTLKMIILTVIRTKNLTRVFQREMKKPMIKNRKVKRRNLTNGGNGGAAVDPKNDLGVVVVGAEVGTGRGRGAVQVVIKGVPDAKAEAEAEIAIGGEVTALAIAETTVIVTEGVVVAGVAAAVAVDHAIGRGGNHRAAPVPGLTPAAVVGRGRARNGRRRQLTGIKCPAHYKACRPRKWR